MGRVKECPHSPRTWSVAPAAGTAGRAHPPSDTDPETPAAHGCHHAQWPLLFSGARCPEPRVSSPSTNRSSALSPVQSKTRDRGQLRTRPCNHMPAWHTGQSPRLPLHLEHSAWSRSQPGIQVGPLPRALKFTPSLGPNPASRIQLRLQPRSQSGIWEKLGIHSKPKT